MAEQEQIAILLIAHGSRHAPANDDLHELAARFVARGEYPIVEACFLELADPDILAGGARCVIRGATRVLMIPYFLSAGVHLTRDLSTARDALRSRHPGVEFRLGPALGPDPLLDRLVSERIGALDRESSPSAFPSSPEIQELYAPMDHHRAG
jgi:sirohydrochlorin ferrochelatase